MRTRLSFLFLFTAWMLSGCDSTSQTDAGEYVFVESYMVANRVLPAVHISATLPIDREYNFSDAALTGATVQVSLLDSNGSPEEIFGYQQSSTNGIYHPEDRSHLVLPRRTYQIDIQFADRPEIIQAVTTVPDKFEIMNQVPDTLTYQSSEQLELIISPTEKTDRQNVFVFSTLTQHPSPDNLTPFYKAAVDSEDFEIDELLINSSGLINEGNFDVNPDGTITLKFPWIGVAFYEDNLVVANLVDNNLNDLVRSQQVQLGGGANISPGEIPNLIYNIDGGIGIFGSLSTDTVQTYFKRP